MSNERWFISFDANSKELVIRKGPNGEIIGSYDEVKKAWFEKNLHNANKEVK